MTRHVTLTRRAALSAGVAATALVATGTRLYPQATSVPERGFVPFAAKMRDLTGFDPLPRDLLMALHGALRDADSPTVLESVMTEAAAPNAAQKRAIKALYHGILAPADGERSAPERLGYSNALQWAAIESSNNVPSFCGGMPGFWAEPPKTDI